MDTSSLIHDFFSKECDECVHLVVDTTLNTDKVANSIFQVGISLFTNDFISFISGGSGGGSSGGGSNSNGGGSSIGIGIGGGSSGGGGSSS